MGTIKCNAPEITNKLTGKGEYSAQAIDTFAAGCFLFELVMKAEPFKSSDMKDEHYSKLANLEKKKFWDIFSGKAAPSLDFKGTSSLTQTSSRRCSTPNPRPVSAWTI